MSETVTCVDCKRLWHGPHTNQGHCPRCRPDLFRWRKDMSQISIPADKIPWLILKRPSLTEPWVVKGHHKSGKWYRYDGIDNAAAASNRHNRQKGLELVVRADRIHHHGILQCPEAPETGNYD